MTEEKLVPVFMPALVSLLVNMEDKKGSPLTLTEVLRLRDAAYVIMLPKSASEKMTESRGYQDIDPENAWYDWQMARRNMGREPELDAGARFAFMRSDDKAIDIAVCAARDSLARFRELIGTADTSAYPLVKVKLDQPGGRLFMWLMVTETFDAQFSAKLFEVPPGSTTFNIGDEFTVRDDDILDWMVNDDGTLYGGYSLRVQRQTMTDIEKRNFDKHVGVETYA